MKIEFKFDLENDTDQYNFQVHTQALPLYQAVWQYVNNGWHEYKYQEGISEDFKSGYDAGQKQLMDLIEERNVSLEIV